MEINKAEQDILHRLILLNGVQRAFLAKETRREPKDAKDTVYIGLVLDDCFRNGPSDEAYFPLLFQEQMERTMQTCATKYGVYLVIEKHWAIPFNRRANADL